MKKILKNFFYLWRWMWIRKILKLTPMRLQCERCNSILALKPNLGKFWMSLFNKEKMENEPKYLNRAIWQNWVIYLDQEDDCPFCGNSNIRWFWLMSDKENMLPY